MKTEKPLPPHKYKFPAYNRADLVGQRFGRLTVAAYLYTRAKRAYWLTLCDCWRTKVASGASLQGKKVSSCGCFRASLGGLSGTPTYISWRSMLGRCYKPSPINKASYFDRGIKVCKRWHDYRKFLRDMGDRPLGKTLDRIDVNGNYCKRNCRWATQTEQMNNTRVNRRITVDGETHTQTEWERIKGISIGTIYARMKNGWSELDAVCGRAK